jgi:hypothetical protein
MRVPALKLITATELMENVKPVLGHARAVAQLQLPVQLAWPHFLQEIQQTNACVQLDTQVFPVQHSVRLVYCLQEWKTNFMVNMMALNCVF